MQRQMTVSDTSAKLSTQTVTDRKSGRATFDNDGRSVWEWQVSTGVFTRTITEDQLTKLATTDLQLVDGPAPRAGWLYDTGEHVAKPRAKAPAHIRAPAPTSGPVARLLKRIAGT
jgi:hypothetical protein